MKSLPLLLLLPLCLYLHLYLNLYLLHLQVDEWDLFIYDFNYEIYTFPFHTLQVDEWAAWLDPGPQWGEETTATATTGAATQQAAAAAAAEAPQDLQDAAPHESALYWGPCAVSSPLHPASAQVRHT
jgi:hypothetical protein